MSQPCFRDLFLKIVTVESRIAQLGAVGIDRRRGAVEQRGDMPAVGNPQPDGGQNAQLGSQRRIGARRKPELRLQQLVDLSDKVGEDIQKGAVERLVEFLVLAVDPATN